MLPGKMAVGNDKMSTADFNLSNVKIQTFLLGQVKCGPSKIN